MLAELSAALEMAWAGNRSFLRNDNKMEATIAIRTIMILTGWMLAF